jgi:hypothetical protein
MTAAVIEGGGGEVSESWHSLIKMAYLYLHTCSRLKEDDESIA